MKYEQFMVSVAKEAGKLILDNFAKSKREYKDNGELVTSTDRAINRLVIERIKKKFPDHDVYGEEESYLSNNSEYRWVCDPIDGTIPFVHQYPTSCFLLALVKGGTPIAGVMIDPYLDRVFYAEQGKGAFLNGKPIKVSSKSDFDGAMVGICWWRTAKHDIIDVVADLARQGAEITMLKSMGYMCALVAMGQLDAVVFPNDTAHDAAAPKIVIEEAGGKCSDIFGQSQRYEQKIDGCIVSNGVLHSVLVDAIKKHLK